MGKKSFLRGKKKVLKNKAFDEMVRLFALSRDSFPAKESLNYSKHAYLFARRHRIAVPREYKESFCKKCYTPLIAGETVLIRFSSGKTPKKIITCKNCGYVKRVGFSKIGETLHQLNNSKCNQTSS